MTGGRNRARIRSGLIRWGISQATQFVWDRGQVGFRQNPEGMRSVIATGLWLCAAAIALDIPLAWLLQAGGVVPLVLAHLFWISLVAWIVLLNIGFLSDLSGRPVGRVGPANVLSFVRIGFLPTLAWLILQRRWIEATVAYLLIALTDVADGIVARRRHEETRLGFVLDPIGDVCMQLAVFIPLYMRERIGDVTMGAVLLRYGVLLGGCLGLYLLRGRIWIKPTPFGRGSGIVTGAAVILLMVSGSWDWPRGRLLLLEGTITLLFMAATLHLLVIGWINFRRPAQAGYGVTRWGLRLGAGPGLRPASGQDSSKRSGGTQPGDRKGGDDRRHGGGESTA